ncbi:HrcA family transcriptional regulator [Cyanobium sp. HWJ4-Hawea]|uniref:HrcA family transcriptional regulator n=1 Tax=unclassified Cyanobium TaxID=2627006 RepID=UPI0020CCC7BC|nr:MULTISPECIES: HrcA family transcriptional regulator [unclassified Cyanobium]MCP9775354.1 HrcA family transcriptional regulator [Cyanobium sp. WAJ14-Wanaka]MCP9808552.1 HrcA family transcriptional regulator [Cyanobium sp. HWJ4-Hawea]
MAVRHYVDTVEPVGSGTLVRRFGLAASPATVRSAMGALEQRGLLTQPHTSAGRIPSQEGYRLFVDQLLPAPGAGALQLQRELLDLSLPWAALDDLLLHLGRRLADLTGLLSLITRPQRPEGQVQALRLVPRGDRLMVFVVGGAAASSHLNLPLAGHQPGDLAALERWVTDQLQGPSHKPIDWNNLPRQLGRPGALLRQALDAHAEAEQRHGAGAVATGLAGLLGQPEFSQTAQLRPLVELVEEAPQQLLQQGNVCIGAEHPHQALRQCAVVQASYRSGDGGLGHVALVGPMRMAYATARAAVASVAELLERLLA